MYELSTLALRAVPTVLNKQHGNGEADRQRTPGEHSACKQNAERAPLCCCMFGVVGA